MIGCDLIEKIHDEIHQAQLDGLTFVIIKYFPYSLDDVKDYAYIMKRRGECSSFYFWGGRLVLKFNCKE